MVKLLRRWELDEHKIIGVGGLGQKQHGAFSEDSSLWRWDSSLWSHLPTRGLIEELRASNNYLSGLETIFDMFFGLAQVGK